MKVPIRSESLDNASKILQRVLIHALPSLYFLVTVSFYLRTYDSAQIKISLFQIGSLALIILWIIKVLIVGEHPFERRDWVFVAPFGALLISGLVSYAHSPFKAMAFDETTRRIFYVGLALIVIGEFRTEESIRRLLRWLVAAAVFTILYGLVQYLDTRLFPSEPGMGIDPFVWRFAFGPRVFSSFGNPNFFGNFLVLMTPVLMALYLKYGGPAWRPFLAWALTALLVWLTDSLTLHLFGPVHDKFLIIYRAGLCLGSLALVAVLFKKAGSNSIPCLLLMLMSILLVSLYGTETKGAWIGFAVAVVVTITLVTRYFVKGESTDIKKLLLGIMLLVTLSSATLLTHFVKHRMTSVNFRVFTWIATWEMIRTHPVLGAGVGSFKVTYPAFRRPQIITIESKSNTETDHAEDEYLEVWHDEGLLGFGIYIWFLLTVILTGLSGLKSLCIRKGEGSKKKLYFEIGADHPHAFDLLGYLAAFFGGLMHWFMDVSVRFVSSGIYFALLPALVTRISEGVALESPPQNSQRERAIRTGVVLFWFVVLLSFRVMLLPSVICCAFLWGLAEMLEKGLFTQAASDPMPKGDREPLLVKPLSLIRALVIPVLFAGGLKGMIFFRGFFLADLHHNMAIFFSKGSLWTKSPEFDTRVSSLPPELQEEYRNTGGALEHYQKVERLNPFFPMAPYFSGNVFNDWGSQVDAVSRSAKNRGDLVAAQTLRDRATQLWRDGLESYQRARRLAPNYVQVHHQIGLIQMKLGDQAHFWGKDQEAQEHYETAMRSFELYRELDPMYPNNYSYLALSFIRNKDYDSVIRLYSDAIHFYDTVAPGGFPEREIEILTNLAKAHYLKASEKNPGRALSHVDSDVNAAEECFQRAVKIDPKRQEVVKGLALLYSRTGRLDQARPFWERLKALNPQDSDVRTIFRSSPH